MASRIRWTGCVAFVAVAVCVATRGESQDAKPPAGCPGMSVDRIEQEVWARIAEPKCLTCHRQGGDAEESDFLLRDPTRSVGPARDEVSRRNREAFLRLAAVKVQGEYRLLVKPVGGLDHGGGEVLKRDSSEYRLLADFVRRANGDRRGAANAPPTEKDAQPFFAGLTMLDDGRVLRRATLSLAGRLPTEVEFAAVSTGGSRALSAVLDATMKEEAFYVRLREGFNDVFLTLGVDGNPDQTCLSYEHFEKTRHWYGDHESSHLKDIEDKDERQRAEWKLAAEYRKTLLEEPMRLVDYIVRHDRPFTEIVTADYIMASPYSARGYGVYDKVKDKFKNAADPFEYVPVKLPALASRDKNDKFSNQESPTGFYPHAGLLSTFQYLTRYPTTETNRNRLRARMYYRHFLGVDVLELAARVTDAAAATAKHKVPTMEAAECVVCHRTLDPAAGLFQDYWRFAEQGVYGRRREGWFTDMFGAGFEGENLPPQERWRALPWLGERTAKDPRFAVAMVEHVYYILFGRKVLRPPKDFDDPLYSAKRRAYDEQRKRTEEIAARFAKNGFNLKHVFKDWILSEFYRVDGPATVVTDACRKAELEDLGVVRMLSPEQLERKVGAVFGERWNRLEGELAMLYGGIDSKEVTERAADPSGAMGAIQRMLSNDVACKHVARDFARPAKERMLFPFVDPATLPGNSPAGDAAIRNNIAYLHRKILGRYDEPNSQDAARTFDLFAGIVADAKRQKNLDKRETWSCRQSKPEPPEDPHYTIRAWRGVVTYLLRRPEFLYE